MVEQEHSKNSAVFPESLISSKTSQNYASNKWLMNNAASMMKSEELCSSEFLNSELLYGTVLSSDETFCCSLSNGNPKEQTNALFQETLPNDVFSINDSSPCDLYYNDKNSSYGKDFWSPMSDKISSDSYFEANSPLSFWGSCPLDLESIKMDEVFQVDKDDLVQSPTLAELNANDESLFDSFDNFEVSLPSELKTGKSMLTSGFNSNSAYKIPLLSEESQVKSNLETSSDRTNLLLSAESSVKNDSFPENGERSGFSPNENKTAVQSSTTYANLKLPETTNMNSHFVNKHVKKMHSSKETSTELSEKKIIEKSSASSLPVNNETMDSEDDSEMDYDYSTDADEESEEEVKVRSSKLTASNNLLLKKKKSRYFWQYNIQSKGPKAPKMKLDGKSVTTDDLSGISDPVFSSSYLIKGVKHAGKARRGDGNDLTPNPQKLYDIGLELEKLTSVIEGLIPANELPLNARIKSRKEKNKLASRACRLKKKAQHEANKLKLYGLQKEQRHLMAVINEVVKVIKKGIDNVKHGKSQSNVLSKVEAIRTKKSFTEVAGCSAEFVNNVLKNVDLGDKTGGLDIEIRDD